MLRIVPTQNGSHQLARARKATMLKTADLVLDVHGFVIPSLRHYSVSNPGKTRKYHSSKLRDVSGIVDAAVVSAIEVQARNG